MDFIKFFIRKPVTVLVGVILVVLFGIIGLLKMPYQLSPDVTEPEISVSTIWTGANPYEIERDIIEEQEKVLKGIPSLIEMESTASNNRGTITLLFKIGTKVDEALLRVSNKLNEVRSYPENVEKPVITATGASTSPIVWIMMKAMKDNPNHIDTYQTYFENEIRQYLERVPGVADLFIGGGRKREMHIIVKPEKLAAYGLTMTDIINSLHIENVNVSAGDMGVGRWNYRVRTVAEFKSPEEIESIIIKSDGQHLIKIGDVADASFDYQKHYASIFHNGVEGTVIGLKAEPGTNVLEVTDNVEAVVKELNEGKLKSQKIYLDWIHDQRSYIEGAIQLVKENIYIGGALAIVVLLVFLQSISATLIISLAIPISIIGTFIIMNALGRNLNVVSLAGIAFAVGMLVDDAIVVLENIDRHHKIGESPFAAAYYGTKEVWGAVLSSSLTTVAVFLPVIFVQQEAGQLFRDIAIAISCSIMLSLVVSVSVVPMLSKQFSQRRRTKVTKDSKPLPSENINFLTKFGRGIVSVMMAVVRFCTLNWVTRIATILLFTSASVIFTFLLLPPMEYLPQGNQNFVLSILIPPPGLSYDERKAVGEQIYKEVEPYFNKDYRGFPGIKDLAYVGADRIMMVLAMSIHEQRAGELPPLFMSVIRNIPGMMGISTQAGVFQTRLGRGRTVNVDISGKDMNELVKIGGMMYGILMKEIPGAQIRPVPSLELTYPEIKIVPDRERLKAAGMNATDLGVALDILMDGRKVGEFKQEGEKKIDLILKASEKDINTPEDLNNALMVTPYGKIVPVSSVAEFERTSGITQIRHLERNRTISLEVTPPFSITVQEAMETIQQKIVPALKAQGALKNVDIRMSGTADKLTETRRALQWNLLLAAVITYLLMASLYGNFIYPFIIMFSVPLAGAGGFIGLKLVNMFIAPQAFDILTMLGFVILIGLVVKNAILIVHQALNNIRSQRMDVREAVLESVRTRIRPIYMTALTTIFGMLPLVIAPGPGSELYRGIGSVVLGGLAVSTFFTVFLIPAILMFFIGMEKKRFEEK